MKKILCNQLGGPAECNEEIKGIAAEELIGNGWMHLQAAHPERAAQIMGNPKDVNDRWMADFKAKFDTLQDA